jgi:hypothetical protein
MSEPPLPRVADPAPRCALLARAAARPQPGLTTAIVCALALAVGGVHSVLGPAAVEAQGANAGSGQALEHAPATVVTSVAVHRCRHRRATTRRAPARATARCAPVPA